MAKRDTRIERYKEVRGATIEALERATDLVRVHNEATVKNRQPRSSLNAVVVSSAMGAWERLLADLWSAHSVQRWYGPGMAPSTVTAAFSSAMRTRWTTTFGKDPVDQWEAKVAYGWRGSKPSPLELLKGNAKGSEGLSLSQVLDQWMELRNGLTHHNLAGRLRAAEASAWRPPDRRKKARGVRSKRRDPYRTNPAVGPREVKVIWRPPTADGLSVQSGAARACLAFVVQFVDVHLQAVAEAEKVGPDVLRLPAEWFARYDIYQHRIHRA